MDEPLKHSVHPVTLVDHRFYEIKANDPDVISFQLMREVSKTKTILVKEWPAPEFHLILFYLDSKFQAGDIDNYGWPDASTLVLKDFRHIDTIQQAIAIVQFWQETYSIFHPEGNSK